MVTNSLYKSVASINDPRLNKQMQQQQQVVVETSITKQSNASSKADQNAGSKDGQNVAKEMVVAAVVDDDSNTQSMVNATLECAATNESGVLAQMNKRSVVDDCDDDYWADVGRTSYNLDLLLDENINAIVELGGSNDHDEIKNKNWSDFLSEQDVSSEDYYKTISSVNHKKIIDSLIEESANSGDIYDMPEFDLTSCEYDFDIPLVKSSNTAAATAAQITTNNTANTNANGGHVQNIPHHMPNILDNFCFSEYTKKIESNYTMFSRESDTKLSSQSTNRTVVAAAAGATAVAAAAADNDADAVTNTLSMDLDEFLLSLSSEPTTPLSPLSPPSPQSTLPSPVVAQPSQKQQIVPCVLVNGVYVPITTNNTRT